MQQKLMFNENTQVHTLPNGVTVTLEYLPYLHSATVGLWIKTGSANETEKQAGISHFLEHLFFKGTTTRDPRQIIEPIECTGGHLNAFTSREYTCIYAKSLASHLHTAIEILGDVLKNSTFAEIDKERNVILEEIASVEDVPEDYAHDLLAARIWPGHPLGRSVSGDEQTVTGITIEDVRRYYQAWYLPQNIYISVAGQFQTEDVLEQITAQFGALPAGPLSPHSTAPVFSNGIECVERDIAQHHICLGFPGPTVTEDNRFVYDVLSCALGGGSTSRLFQRIREDEGLAYSIYSFHSAYLTAGMFGVYGAYAPENFDRALDLTFEELRKFRDAPLPQQEFENNREHLKGSMLMSFESTFNRMARMAKSMMYYGRLVTIGELLDGFDRVTIGAVQSLAQQILTPEQCVLLILGPPLENAKPGIML